MPLGLLTFALLFAQQTAPPAKETPSPDYVFFRERVQPILLNKRPGHARCVTCHEHGTPALQPMAPGATGWDEDQSRKNFDIWKRYIIPGMPARSPMLLHPLARDAGGDFFHAGGKHWQSQSDPEWQTLADWVRGRTLDGPK